MLIMPRSASAESMEKKRLCWTTWKRSVWGTGAFKIQKCFGVGGRDLWGKFRWNHFLIREENIEPTSSLSHTLVNSALGDWC